MVFCITNSVIIYEAYYACADVYGLGSRLRNALHNSKILLTEVKSLSYALRSLLQSSFRPIQEPR